MAGAVTLIHDSAVIVSKREARMRVYDRYREKRIEAYQNVYDKNAVGRDLDIEKKAYLYNYIRDVLNYNVEENKRVLCINSDMGQYLRWVNPSRGVGVECSPKLVQLSSKKHPQFVFHNIVPEDFVTDEKFDYILLINAVNDLIDVQKVLENVQGACERHTRIVILWYNYLWKPVMTLAEKVGLKRKQPSQNWLSLNHFKHIMDAAGYEVTRFVHGMFFPYKIPFISAFFNDFLIRLPLLDYLSMIQVLVARPTGQTFVSNEHDLGVSVIIPCRNEKGNVECAVTRTPQMGRRTELIFCDDQSTDGTAEEVCRVKDMYPDKNIKLVHGPGICKAKNVWAGFNESTEDILMILDGDLTVPPEELPKFFHALVQNKGEFINGTRAVYPMEDKSMRFVNVLGNKAFSFLFSSILRRNVTDTLCGTKTIWRRDWVRIKPFLGSWGIDDRWGDYEIIFGAARLGLKQCDMPIHYMERIYGETKMTGRLRNAWIMLRMCMSAYLNLR